VIFGANGSGAFKSRRTATFNWRQEAVSYEMVQVFSGDLARMGVSGRLMPEQNVVWAEGVEPSPSRLISRQAWLGIAR
jgi:hypothetical protein